MNKIEILKYADEKLRSDSGFMLSMIKQDPVAFSYATDELKLRKDFIAQSIDINMSILKYVDSEIKAELEYLVFKNQDYAQFFYKDNSEFRNEDVRRFLEGDFEWEDMEGWDVKINNLKLAKCYVKKCGDNMRYIPSENFANKTEHEDLFLKALACPYKEQCSCSEVDIGIHASYKQIDDKKFMLRAIQVDPFCYEHVSERLQIDLDILKKFKERCMNEDYCDFNDYVEKIKDQIRHTIGTIDVEDDAKKYLALSDKFFNLVSDNLKSSREFLFEALLIAPRILEIAPHQFDEEILIKAINKDISIMDYLPIELKNNKAFFKKLIEIKKTKVIKKTKADSLLHIKKMFEDK